MRTIIQYKNENGILILFSEHYLFENRFGGDSHLADALIILAKPSSQSHQILISVHPYP